jgi:hypothetical protein
MSESRKYTAAGYWLDELCTPPRVSLERMCDQIRDRLEEEGLPTDRTPNWIRIPGEDWKQADRDENVIELRASYALWTSRLKDLTEPLSIERAAGDLLWSLLQLLGRENIDEHLWHVAQLMQSYASFRMLGPINEAAQDGLVARKGRAAGPASKRQKALEIRDTIWAHTHTFWSENPSCKGDATNTAGRIAAIVNEELRIKGLLPAKKGHLSTKTIADHIRTCIRG